MAVRAVPIPVLELVVSPSRPLLRPRSSHRWGALLRNLAAGRNRDILLGILANDMDAYFKALKPISKNSKSIFPTLVVCVVNIGFLYSSEGGFSNNN